MTVVLLCYLAFPATIFVLLRAFKVRDRKYLFGIPLVILCLPVLLGISVYVLRTPIQQGKLLPELGPLLNLAFPAQDLYLPLASEAFSSQKKIYTFRVSHKYLGKHGVFIDIPGKSHVVTNTDGGLNLVVKVMDGDKELFAVSGDKGYFYSGTQTHGYNYVRYRVPEDLPVSKELTFEISLGSDLTRFLSHHSNVSLIVRKVSDL